MLRFHSVFTFALFKTILNNKMKTTFNTVFSTLVFLFSVVALAQTGSISGKVSAEQSSDNISVTLKGTPIGTNTDSDGFYQIKNIKPGNYVLKVSSVGNASKERNITVRSGDELVENFTVSTSSEELSEVILETEKTNRFARKESAVVAKMPLKDIENPQVYNTISSELLKEQVITNFDDALKNAPGLDKLWESTGRGSDGAGYFSLRGFAVQPTMINGVPGLTNGSPDPANVERIEVIKGPSGTLFGSSLISYGGLINVSTKRPYDTFGGSIGYVGGTYGLNRYTVDFNTPLDEQKNVLFRVNAAYHTEGSFQDAGFKKSFFVAPTLSYKVNDKLSFLINTEFYNGRSTNQMMLFVDRGAPLISHNIGELGYDPKRSYTGNDLYIDTPTFSLQGQMNYTISKEWTSQTILSRTSAKSDGYYSYLYETTQFTTVTDGQVFGRYLSKQNSETYGTDLQQNFNGDFKIGTIRNRVLAGVDYWNSNNTNNGSNYVNNGMVYIGNNLQQFNENVLGVTDPTLFTDDSGILNQAGTDALLAGSKITPSKTKQQTYSAYVSDVVNITPALSAMAALRLDRFINEGDLSTKADNFNQTAFSPKFGVVYQPILNKLSVFANYMNGFTNVAPITTPGNNIFTFEAEQANQIELGTKLNLFGDKIVASVSYYDIKVKNTVLQISPEEYLQDGTQKNKGFETSITASPFSGFNIIAGYSYNDSRLETTTPGNEFAGRRPESAGPQNLANLWASYKFPEGKLKGFGLGFGGNYASENKIFNRTAGILTLPEYTILNASASYSVDAFTINLKVDNLTNKEYYKGWSTISPQRPRIFSVGMNFNF